MRFSDLKKNKQLPLEKKEEQKSSIQQKPIDDVENKKEFDIELHQENLSTESKKIQVVSVTKSDIIKPNLEKKTEVTQKSYSGLKFSDVEYERVVDFYSILLKKFDDVLTKISDASYLTAADDLRYLTAAIYEEIENPYIILMLSYFTPRNYIVSHSINVAILSGVISKILNLEKYNSLNIITAALCIDLGMPPYRYLYSSEKSLSKSEKDIIKMHVPDGVEIVEKIFSFEDELKKFVSNCVKNSHERYNGSGYYSKSGDELDIFSQIISISDFYEALTHPRPWRNAFDEPFVIELITSKYRDLFAPQVVKGLVSSLGMYPPGSIVKLSTGEIAEVIFVNKEKIFRPSIKTVMDSSFKEIPNRHFNLVDYPLTSIESYVKGEEVAKLNPDFKTAFDLKRLWIRW